MSESLIPERPDLVFRAGFVGNCDLPADPEGKLPAALREIVSIMAHRLAAISPKREGPPFPKNSPIGLFHYFSENYPRLHLVSGLAEGADALARKQFPPSPLRFQDRQSPYNNERRLASHLQLLP